MLKDRRNEESVSKKKKKIDTHTDETASNDRDKYRQTKTDRKKDRRLK